MTRQHPARSGPACQKIRPRNPRAACPVDNGTARWFRIPGWPCPQKRRAGPSFAGEFNARFLPACVPCLETILVRLGHATPDALKHGATRPQNPALAALSAARMAADFTERPVSLLLRRGLVATTHAARLSMPG